jgi:hypothetical protein
MTLLGLSAGDPFTVSNPTAVRHGFPAIDHAMLRHHGERDSSDEDLKSGVL